jgi:peptidoglycan/LPS O-acetylase OafA/YrhL
MGSVRQYKSTALTILVIALVVLIGVGLVVDPDSPTADRTWGIAVLVAEAAAGVGLWCLATKRLTVGASEVLVVVGLVAAGALAIFAVAEDFSFFVWSFGPLLVLALLALWFGVVNRGLRTELAG